VQQQQVHNSTKFVCHWWLDGVSPELPVSSSSATAVSFSGLQDIANVLWGIAQLTRDYGVSSLVLGCPSLAADDEEEEELMLQSAVQMQPESSQQVLAVNEAVGQGDLGGGNISSSSMNFGGETRQQQQHLLQPPGSNPSEQQLGQQHLQAHLLQRPLLTSMQVHLLLQQLCTMLPLAASQTISNIAWAVTVLQQCHNWCMCESLQQIRMLATAFAGHLRDALPGHVQRVIRCTTQLSSACSNHAGLSWVQWQPPILQALLSHTLLQRKALKQYHVASVLKDVTHIALLFLPPEAAKEVQVAAATTGATDVQQQQQAPAAAAAVACSSAPVAGVEQQLPVRLIDSMPSAATGQQQVNDVTGGATQQLLVPEVAAAPVASLSSPEVHVSESKLAAVTLGLSTLPGAAVDGCSTGLSVLAAHLAAVAAGLIPPGTSPPAGTTPLAAAAAVEDDEPQSPCSAVVHQLVAGLFRRLLLSSEAAATASGSWAAMDESVGGVPETLGSVAEVPAIQQPSADLGAAPGTRGEKLPPDNRTASSSAATAAVLAKVLPQLNELGMLPQYNALRSLYPSCSIPQLKVVEAHAVAARSAQQQESSELPPLVQFPVQAATAEHKAQGLMALSSCSAGQQAAAVTLGISSSSGPRRSRGAAGGVGGEYMQQYQPNRLGQQQVPAVHASPPPPPPPAGASPRMHQHQRQRQQQQQQHYSMLVPPGNAATSAYLVTSSAAASTSSSMTVSAGPAMPGDVVPQSPFEHAAALAAAAIGTGSIGSGASQVTMTNSSGNYTLGTPSASSMSSITSHSAAHLGDKGYSYASSASGEGIM
jgi:hypothetical protein